MCFLAFLAGLPVLKKFRTVSYDLEQSELFYNVGVEIYTSIGEFHVEDPIDFLSFPDSIQKRVFEKIPDHKSFTQFEAASRATRDLSENNENILFTERKRGTLHVKNNSSFPYKYRCLHIYYKIRIMENCHEVLSYLLTLPAEVKHLAVKDPAISKELLSKLIKKLRLQSLTTNGSYSNDVFGTEDIAKLHRICIMGGFNDQYLTGISSQMPRSVQLYKTGVTSAGVIAFCEEAIAGHRELKKFRVTKSKLCSARKVAYHLNAKRDIPRCPDHGGFRTLEKNGIFWLFVAKQKDFVIKRYKCQECQNLL